MMKYMNCLAIVVCLLGLNMALEFTAAEDGVALLKKDVGTWDCEISLYQDPASAPSVSKGTETNVMIGEYWLVSHFKGSMMGAPFEGSSQTGYDPEKKKFTGSWVDSMSPHAMKTEGTWDEKNQTLTSTGEAKDPAGNPMKYKMTVVYKPDNSRLFTMFGIINGADVKMMEVKYTKAKESLKK